MRIALVSTPFVSVPPRRYGGTELVVANLAAGLAAFGHDVTVFATGDSSIPVRLRCLYPRAMWPPNGYHELAHAAFAFRELTCGDINVDVIHAHAAPALAFAPFVKVPLVYTVHHERDEALCALYRSSQCPNVTMVAISERQRELLADTCSARVIHHGLDASLYPLGRGKGGYAAFLGRFAREKGVHCAIDVAKGAGVPIRLAGKAHPPDLDYFRDEVAPRLSWPGVGWCGEAAHGQKIALFGGAMATLFPIDWEEPFGLVLAESMLCGTPVLAFPRGAAREIIEDGVTGYLVTGPEEMAERLKRVAQGLDNLERSCVRARAVERFGMERMVKAYLAVYEEVIARHG